MHRRYGHIQEVIIQNFLPKHRTLMAHHPAASDEEFHWTIAAARLLLPTNIHLQAPPNLSDSPARLLDFGIDDFGGISPVTVDHVNPERAWPAIAALSAAVSDAGLNLAPRLTIYPEFARDLPRWTHVDLHRSIRELANAEMRGREDAWASGGDTVPPTWNLPQADSSTPIGRLIEEWEPLPQWSERELASLFSARGSDLALITEFADEVRRQRSGDDVTYVVNRNINYTNVCTFKCRFCAFSKGPLSLNLRGDPYLLSLEQIAERVIEARAAGATEVCLQGGIHPKFDGDYYIDVVKAVHDAVPDMHIHAFSALEIYEGARRSDLSLESYLGKLKEVGLRTLPGTAAEILDDEVRRIICPDKIDTQQWLDVHRAAHSVGLNSNVTIMFGSVEGPEMWARHLMRTRELQLETGGFTEFVPLPYVHMATPMFVRGQSRRGPTFRETVLMHSVGRLFYAGAIDNIQVSWVKIGAEGSRRVLRAGANDVGGTLMDENISRAAGAVHGQEMDADALREMVAPLGRPLVQRSTLYKRI
jgi:FO synthase